MELKKDSRLDVVFPHVEGLQAVESDDDFLVREGLDMLASYRRIRNPDIRLSIRKLLETMAQVNYR